MRQAWPLIVFPLAKLVLHLVTFRGYGMFRDEFYYLACADHLAWGYVDQPPLSIAVLALVKLLIGDSLFAVRLPAAVTGSLTVLVVGLIARRFGGGRGAQSLAMAAALGAPIYLSLNHFYSMNALDILAWALAAYLVIDLVQKPRTSRWSLLGLLLGLGLLNKISVLWLGFGLLVGLLTTRQRSYLRTRGPWIAGAIAASIFLPHALWQLFNDWPTLEFIRNASSGKMLSVSPAAFLRSQVMMMNPVSAPLWIGGLVWLFRSAAARPYRLLGVIYLTVLSLLVLNGTSRAGYLSPTYTWLFPAGAVGLQSLWNRDGERLAWILAALLLFSGGLLAPFGLPLLPVERYISYAEKMGIGPSTSERKELAELPQFYADMHGWDSIVDTVAGVYESLPAAEQSVASIFTFNYGDAGAVDYLGKKHGLPPAIGGHNNYWLWGTRGQSGDVVIVLGDQRENLEQSFKRVELAATVDCGYCMPYENNTPVWICRDARRSLAELWPELKHYD